MIECVHSVERVMDLSTPPFKREGKVDGVRERNPERGACVCVRKRRRACKYKQSSFDEERKKEKRKEGTLKQSRHRHCFIITNSPNQEGPFPPTAPNPSSLPQHPPTSFCFVFSSKKKPRKKSEARAQSGGWRGGLASGGHDRSFVRLSFFFFLIEKKITTRCR